MVAVVQSLMVDADDILDELGFCGKYVVEFKVNYIITELDDKE